MLRYCLLVFAIFGFGCSESVTNKIEQKIEFQVFFQGSPASCQELETAGINITDFRMFLDQLKFFSSRAAIAQHSTSQIQYLDFIQGGCSDQNLVQSLSILESKNIQATDVFFQIGVPNQLNHQNPVKAETPLNISTMHWQWLSGYKFLRLEFQKGKRLNRFHLGSWGCSGKLPNDVLCKQPNLIPILLKDFNLDTSVVEVHVDVLLNVESESLCMGDPNDNACNTWVGALKNNVFKVGAQINK